RFVHADSVLDGPGVLAEPSADRLGEPIGKEMHVRIDDHEDLPFADSRMSALPIRSGGDGCLGAAHRTRTADLTRCALRNSSLQALAGIELRADVRARERRSLDARLAEFGALPTSSQELVLLSALQTDLRGFDESVEYVIAQIGSGHRDEAKATLVNDVRARAGRAVATAGRLVDLEARMAEDAALRIEQVHQRSDRVALQMDALCILLAGVAAWLVLRAVLRARRIEQQHRAMLERRADELEEFAGRVAHDVLSPLSAVGLALSVAQSSGPPALQSAVRRGASSLQRVRGIVDALLEFDRSG